MTHDDKKSKEIFHNIFKRGVISMMLKGQVMRLNQKYFMDILENVRRSGYTSQDLFPELYDKEKIQSILDNVLLQDYIAEIKDHSEEYRKRKINILPFSLYKLYETEGNRLQFEQVYFERRGRLMTFALLSWLYGEKEDLIELEDILWAICDEYSWSLPAHMPHKDAGIDPSINIDLFAAETAFALAEILYLLDGQLSSAVVHRVKKEVFRRVLDSYMYYPKLYNWELMKNNWCAVCAGSIGAVAIYFIEDDTILAKLFSRLMPTLENFIDSFEEDGTCVEGLSYWTYGISFYVSFADLLLRRTAGKVNLLNNDKFKKIAEFQHKCYFSGGCTVSFSDGSQYDYFRRGITSYLANQFDHVYIPPQQSASGYVGDRIYRWCMGLRDLLWTDAVPMKEIPNTASYVLPDAQWIICRNGEEGHIGFAAKGGHNDEPHNHNDIGSFIYTKDGKMLLTDLGCGEYTKDYFNHNRYTIFCNHSFSHSVPIIEGEGQYAGKNYHSTEVKFERENFMSLNIEKAYHHSNLQKLVRSFEFLGSEGLILKDKYSFKSMPNSVIERFVTTYMPIIIGDVVEIKAGNTTARICYDKGKMTPSILEHTHIDHSGEEVIVYSIDFVIKMEEPNFICIFEIR